MESKEVEWSDAEVFINGVKITKIQGFNYKSTKEKEFLYAAGDAPIGIQGGNRSYTGSLKLLKGAVDSLNAAARAAGGSDLLDVTCVVVINYKAKSSRLVQTDTLSGLQFTEYVKGMEQNAKSVPIELPMMYLEQTSTGG